jgi:DNA ligase-1
MKRFAELFATLDADNRTNAKLAALTAYFREAEPADAAWAVAFFLGKKPRSGVNAAQLREWAAAEAGVPDWLFAESYTLVGDLAETISLLFPEHGTGDDRPLGVWAREVIARLAELPEAERREVLVGAWRALDRVERFVLVKLITGGWRVGVSQRLLTRALAAAFELEPDVAAHRLMGEWTPSAEFFENLVSHDASDVDHARPYPFHLAHPLEGDPSELGEIGDWLMEWKWDGIRAQLLHRGGEVAIWSRGEESVTHQFPELVGPIGELPRGVALDGEIVAWDFEADRVAPFATLQRRLGRKQVGRKLLAEAPVVFLAYDLLEDGGEDIRGLSLAERRVRLERLVGDGERIRLSPTIDVATWAELATLREESRARAVEGIMLKRLDSAYEVGRKKGPWWKWKVDPYTVDAVLIYAQRGHGRRAGLYTDYTFGVWDGDELVPFAKAYSGLDASEIDEVDAFVRRHSVERFGPVRRVEPRLVFEIAFEGIRPSGRHKSGVAVRFPRMARWRRDKTPAEADTIETVRALLRADPL